MSLDKFKVGDRVKILTNIYDGEGYLTEGRLVKEGLEVTITSIDNAHYLAEGSQKNDSTVFFDDDDIELVLSIDDRLDEAHNYGFMEAAQHLISTLSPKKYNDNKPMMSLIRPEFQLALAEALTYGYTKYEEQRGDLQNYLKGDGFHYSTLIDSLERHLNAFKSGINIDEESGLDHLVLAAANIMFLHTYEQCEKGIDDRVKIGVLDE